MKYIDRSKVEEPANLKGQAAPAENEEIKKSIYGHADVKTALNKLQLGVCCFCESRYEVTGYGDVEHFRPKQGYQQDKTDKTLHKPGYYWLAYKWNNLLYACNRCNRKYKQNYFPLKDPSKRFKPDTLDITQEVPLLINPYEEEHPENHLTFEGPEIKGKTEEGRTSIEYYGLDRKELYEERLGICNMVNALIKVEGFALNPEDKQETKGMIKSLLQDKMTTGQHTLMIKCNYGQYL